MNVVKVNVIAAWLALVEVGQAGPLDHWTLRYQLPAPATMAGFSAIAYGNGQFVAVGDLGTIVTSTDGVSWIQRQSKVENSLSGVSYGNGRFVAVGDLGIILSSPDGINWTQLQSGTSNSLAAVTYGDGRFVVVGAAILVSTNAVNWAVRQPLAGAWLASVAYGNGQFVAVSPHGTQRSVDGVDWEVGGDGAILRSGTYGEGQFVAGGANSLLDGPWLGTSADGVNWVEQNSGTHYRAYFWGLAYGSGQFVGVGPTIVTSGNGVSWVEREVGTTNGLSGITYGNGYFVAVGGSKIFQSGSSSTLTLTSTPASGHLKLSLSGEPGSSYLIESSTDLVVWHSVTNLTLGQPTNVVLEFAPSSGDGQAFFRASSD